MRRLIRKIIPLLAIALIISCGDDSTGPDTEPDPDSNSDPEPTTGIVEITTATSGEDQNEDGYTITLGDDEEDISASETITFEELDEGSYDAELSGIADNCSVDGDNPRSVEVTAGETSSETFEVVCEAGTPKIVFHRYIDSSYKPMIMNSDGSEVENLTGNSGTDPELSNDGTKIVYKSFTGLYVLDIESGEVEQLTSIDGVDDPSWSPDDSQITFASDDDGSDDIYIINADGSNQRRVTGNGDSDTGPVWSPDGQEILFHRSGNLGDLYTIGSDGNDLSRLTEHGNGGVHPDWSQEAGKVAFVSSGIHIMDPDGSDIEQIADEGELTRTQPNWSPDGTELVFHEGGDIYKISVFEDDSPQAVTDDEYSNGSPSWGLLKE